MCGFVRNVIDSPGVRELMTSVGLGDLVAKLGGGDSRQRGVLRDMIFCPGGNIVAHDAIWWYAQKREAGRLVPNMDVTSFNARDLTRPLWRNAIRRRRGLIVATAIGESNPVPNRKAPQQYLIEGATPMLLGALYKEWEPGMLSAAIITRSPHPRFSVYHEKSTPFFLPPDPEFIALWLDQTVDQHPLIDQVLEDPRLYYGLHITPVASYKSGKAQGDTVLLEADSA